MGHEEREAKRHFPPPSPSHIINIWRTRADPLLFLTSSDFFFEALSAIAACKQWVINLEAN